MWPEQANPYRFERAIDVDSFTPIILIYKNEHVFKLNVEDIQDKITLGIIAGGENGVGILRYVIKLVEADPNFTGVSQDLHFLNAYMTFFES